MASEQKEKAPVTPKGRVSFPHLDKRAVFEGEEEKFDVTLLFDPKTKEFKEFYSKVLKATVEEMGPKEKWPKGFKWPFKKGEEFITDGEVWDGYEGMAVLKLKSDFDVPCFDKELRQIPREKIRDLVYGGCYGRASYKVNVYDKKSKGVSLILLGFQKLDDGEKFGGGGNAADAFDDELSDKSGSDDFDTDSDDDLGF